MVGDVDGQAVRSLHAGGDELADVVVWAEVFARCHDPSTTVRWSGFDPAPSSLRVTYQGHAAGGCANTTAAVDGGGVLQVTNAVRAVGHGTLIPPGT